MKIDEIIKEIYEYDENTKQYLYNPIIACELYNESVNSLDLTVAKWIGAYNNYISYRNKLISETPQYIKSMVIEPSGLCFSDIQCYECIMQQAFDCSNVDNMTLEEIYNAVIELWLKVQEGK